MELSEISVQEQNDERRPIWGRPSRSSYTRLMSSGRGSWKMRNSSTSSATGRKTSAFQDDERRLQYLQSPFFVAARRGNIEEFKKLIEEQDAVSLNALNNDMTALHVAAKFFSREIAEILLKCGAKANTRTDGDKSSALHYALRYENKDVAEVLLDYGADAGLADINGSTPLHFAASRGLSSLVKKILDTGTVNIDVYDGNCNTALHHAGRGSETETCKVLLEMGASLEVLNANGESPMHLAAEVNNVEVLELFLKAGFGKRKEVSGEGKPTTKNYIDKPRTDKKTALHIAALIGNIDVVRFLIDQGADVSTITSDQSTPAHLAAAHGNTNVLEVLLDAEGSSNAKDIKGRTPLHEAALAGHTDSMKLLLDKGADMDARDCRRSTPLLNAVRNDFNDAAILLLNHHADTSAKDYHLRHALHFACENGNYVLATLLLEKDKKLIHSTDDQNMTALHYTAQYGLPKILKLLMSKTMHLVDIDSTGQTPLHLASKYGNVSCVSLLAGESEKGTVNHPNSSDQTPLHVAVIHKQLESCKALIKYGADLNSKDKASWTPLHYAALHEDTSILNELLLQFGVKKDCKDENWNTPLMVAAEAGNHVAVTCLMDEGADLCCLNQDKANFFDIALEYQRESVCEGIVKHNRWEEALVLKTENKSYYMSKLIEKYPDVAEIALDRSCSFSEHPSDHPDVSVTYNYQFLEEYPEVQGKFMDSAVAFIKHGGRFFFAPSVMGKHRRQALISHPITKSLFNLKWQRFGRYLYYTSFFFYLLFVISLNISVILESEAYVFKRVKALNANSSSYAWRRSLNTLTSEGPSTKEFGKALGSIVLAFCILQMVIECIQAIVLRLKYFAIYTNYFEITLYVTSFYYIYTFLFRNQITKATYEVGVLCAFLGWVNVMFYLQRVPTFRIHIVMFEQVCLSILKVMVVFGVMFLAFIFAFYMLFMRQTSFQRLSTTTAKVFVMMTGEFDYDDVLTGNLNEREAITNYPLVPFPNLAYVVFLSFVFLITLAFTNLLIGLAVGDIEKIRELAALTIQRQQLDFVENIQGILPVNLLRRFMTTPTETVYLNKYTRFGRVMEYLTNDESREELLKLRMKLLKSEDEASVADNDNNNIEAKAMIGKAAILEKLIVKQQRMFEEIRSIRNTVAA